MNCREDEKKNKATATKKTQQTNNWNGQEALSKIGSAAKESEREMRWIAMWIIAYHCPFSAHYLYAIVFGQQTKLRSVYSVDDDFVVYATVRPRLSIE